MDIILSLYVLGDVVLSEAFESVAIPQTWVIPEIDSFQEHYVKKKRFSPHKFFFGAYAENTEWVQVACERKVKVKSWVRVL